MTTEIVVVWIKATRGRGGMIGNIVDLKNCRKKEPTLLFYICKWKLNISIFGIFLYACRHLFTCPDLPLSLVDESVVSEDLPGQKIKEGGGRSKVCRFDGKCFERKGVRCVAVPPAYETGIPSSRCAHLCRFRRLWFWSLRGTRRVPMSACGWRGGEVKGRIVCWSVFVGAATW